jgi:hypothetical protein
MSAFHPIAVIEHCVLAAPILPLLKVARPAPR